MVIECVCCDSRIDSKNRRPFHGIAMRLFVSARRNICLPASGYICNSCQESNENIIDHDHKNDNENFESAMETSTDEPIDTNTVLLPLNVVVSSHRTLSTVREALSSEFIPQYLGFQSISRQDVINTYSSPLATRLLSEDMNTVVLVADGTYLYLQ
ncbi:unnamed protein product, partial [Rotaria sordida]